MFPLTLQTQPTQITCVHTCLAMALRVPVAQVIDRYGPQPMSQQALHAALNACGFTWNAFVYGALIAPGWHFLTVPSLNIPGGNHMILCHNDPEAGCSGLTVLDPSFGKTYAPDGSTLRSWSHPILFIPGGTLPRS
jgi:hypothetical protein